MPHIRIECVCLKNARLQVFAVTYIRDTTYSQTLINSDNEYHLGEPKKVLIIHVCNVFLEILV